MSLRVLADREVKKTPQGHFEEIAEATANKPGNLGGPHPGLTGMEKIREDWFSNLRGQPDCCRQILARKSPVPRTNLVDAQALPTCPHCQRIFQARIGLVGHFRTE
ncbi:unnamed protein product [Schistocephalus solidus]|uniref:C2H2-type domain-containing protein n=1 Tax=Schistocephalus solidus TaxID=70667 RepID=A0A183TML6_SCHSO|nr:unnamed protein product [Schistocephalus solidus]